MFKDPTHSCNIPKIEQKEVNLDNFCIKFNSFFLNELQPAVLCDRTCLQGFPLEVVTGMLFFYVFVCFFFTSVNVDFIIVLFSKLIHCRDINNIFWNKHIPRFESRV